MSNRIFFRPGVFLVLAIAAAMLFTFGPAHSATASANNTGTLNLVHGIPGAEVDVCARPANSDEEFARVLTGFNFKDIETLELPEGSYDAVVVLTGEDCSNALPGLSASGLSLPAGANVSVVAHLTYPIGDGTVGNSPFTLTVGVNDTTEAVGRRSARVTAYHTAAAPSVDISAGKKRPESQLFAGVKNGDTGSVDVRPGKYRLAVIPAGGSAQDAVAEARVRLPKRVNTVIYAVGSLEPDIFSLLIQEVPLNDGHVDDETKNSTGTLNLVHGIPGAEVDACARPANSDEEFAKVLTGFNFKDIETLELPEGSYDAAVVLTGEDCSNALPGLSASGLSLSAGANVSVVAHLTGDGNAFTLTAGVNDTTEAVGRRSARVTAYHTAAAPSVDISAGKKRPESQLFAGVKNGDTGSVDVRPGKYRLAVVPAGGSARDAVAEARVRLPKRVNTVIYAVGSLDPDSFSLLIQEIPLNDGDNDDDDKQDKQDKQDKKDKENNHENDSNDEEDD